MKPLNLLSKVAIFSILERMTLFYSILVPMVKINNDMSTSSIGFVLLSQELSKMLFDYISGCMVGFFNFRIIIITGLIFKIIGLSAWIYSKKITFLITGIIFIGIGRACVYAKIEPFFYHLLISDEKKLFVKLSSFHMIFNNVGAVISGITAIILYKIGGFNAVLYGAIFILFVHIIFTYFSFDKVTTNYKKKKVSFNIFFKSSLLFFKKNPTGIKTFMFLVLFSFMFYFVTNFYKIILVDLKYSPTYLMQVYAIIHLIPILMSLGLIKIGKIEINKLISVASFLFVIISIISIKQMRQTPFIMIIYLFIFPVIRTTINAYMNNITNDQNRVLIFSLADTAISSLNVILFGIMSLITIWEINYYYIILIIMTLVTIMLQKLKY